MRVYRRITTKKTQTGYQVSVLLKEGQLVKPLIRNINRFFVMAERILNGEDVEAIRRDAEEQATKLKEAKIA